MEREVSLPYAPPTPAPTRRPIERAENSALRLEVASMLEQRTDDIAARWVGDARALLPDATISTVEGASASPRGSRLVGAPSLVRALAASLASRDDAAEEVTARGHSLGVSAFASGMALHALLHALDQLTAVCLDAVEEAVGSERFRATPLDVMRVCRLLEEAAGAARLASTRGFVEAADHALLERFRRLRHDLRNPIGTIRSALSLMADETVPEEARRSPRFSAMIERNATSLDQLIVARLSDAEARLLPTAAPGVPVPSSAVPLVGESRDDLSRARESDDRQAGSF